MTDALLTPVPLAVAVILLIFVLGLTAFAGSRWLGIANPRRMGWLTIGAFALTLTLLAPATLPAGYIFWTAILFPLLLLLGLTDAQTYTVPDGLTVPLIALGCLHATLHVPGWMLFLVGPIALVTTGMVAAWILPERLTAWVGGGDVLLLAGALAWLGPASLFELLCLVCLLAPLSALANRPQNAMSPEGSTTNTESPDLTAFPLAPAIGLATAFFWVNGPLF